MNILYELGSLEQYVGTYLSLVVEAEDDYGLGYCEALDTLDISEVDLSKFKNPSFFFSVYARSKTGQSICAADFETLEDAQIFCHALDCLL